MMKILISLLLVTIIYTSSASASSAMVLDALSGIFLTKDKSGSSVLVDGLFDNNYTKIVSQNNSVSEDLYDGTKKSVSSIDRVIVFEDKDYLIDPYEAKEIFETHIKLSRFDENSVVISANRDVFASVDLLNSNMVSQVSEIVSDNYLMQIKQILNDPDIQKQRISQFKEPSYSFKFSKGRSYSVTKKDLESLFNSSYIYVPYIEKVTYDEYKFKEKVDEDTYKKKVRLKVKIKAGLLWYQLKYNPNSTSEIVMIAHIKSLETSDEDFDGHTVYESDILNLSKKVLNTIGSNFNYATRSLDQFKLYAKVVQSENNNHVFLFPKSIPVSINDHFWLMENYETEKGIKSKSVGLSFIKSKKLTQENIIQTEAVQIYGNNDALMSWVKEVPYKGVSVDIGYYNANGFHIDYKDAPRLGGGYLFDKSITSARGAGISGSLDISKFINSPMSFIDLGGVYYPISINYYNYKNPDSYMTQFFLNFRKVFWIKHFGISPFLGGGLMKFEIKESDEHYYKIETFGVFTGVSLEKMIRPFLSLELRFQQFLSLGFKTVNNTIDNFTYSNNADYSKMNSSMVSLSFKITK